MAYWCQDDAPLPVFAIEDDAGGVGGWTADVGGVFSETLPTREAALEWALIRLRHVYVKDMAEWSAERQGHNAAILAALDRIDATAERAILAGAPITGAHHRAQQALRRELEMARRIAAMDARPSPAASPTAPPTPEGPRAQRGRAGPTLGAGDGG